MDDDDDGDDILTKDEDSNGNGNLADDDDDMDSIPNYLDAMPVGVQWFNISDIVQPNPNTGVFKVSAKQYLLSIEDIEIYNAVGQSVAFNIKANQQIEMISPENGIYIIYLPQVKLWHKVLVQY